MSQTPKWCFKAAVSLASPTRSAAKHSASQSWRGPIVWCNGQRSAPENHSSPANVLTCRHGRLMNLNLQRSARELCSRTPGLTPKLFQACNSHQIQYSMGFTATAKGIRWQGYLLIRLKTQLNWLTFCMDYHMLENQNFSLASIQPCVSPSLPKLIFLNQETVDLAISQHLSEREQGKGSARRCSKHSCVQLLLFLIFLLQ